MVITRSEPLSPAPSQVPGRTPTRDQHRTIERACALIAAADDGGEVAAPIEERVSEPAETMA